MAKLKELGREIVPTVISRCPSVYFCYEPRYRKRTGDLRNPLHQILVRLKWSAQVVRSKSYNMDFEGWDTEKFCDALTNVCKVAIADLVGGHNNASECHGIGA